MLDPVRNRKLTERPCRVVERAGPMTKGFG